MLRGIIEQREISKESLEAKKHRIQEEALKRFTENGSKRDSGLEKESVKLDTLQLRRNMLNDYDSIAMERIMGKSDLFPIAYLQILFAAFKFAMIRVALLAPERAFWFLIIY